MKIATWNVNSLNVRLPQVLDWLKEHEPDILALQELKQDNNKFPEREIEEIGFQAAWNGQKTYNGVAIISKKKPQNIQYGINHFEDEQKRVISVDIDDYRIINVYCVNGESLTSDKFHYKKRWFQALHQHMATTITKYKKIILLGDFNIAPSPLDVYDPEKFKDKILCSDEERSWYQSLLELGLYDSIKTLSPNEPNFTWWDYRMNGFKRNLGLRIDHILLSEQLIKNIKEFGIDTNARAHSRPSDHAPVWITLD